jgi:hypothetical protein
VPDATELPQSLSIFHPQEAATPRQSGNTPRLQGISVRGQPASTSVRGYGTEHQRLRESWSSTVNAGEVEVEEELEVAGVAQPLLERAQPWRTGQPPGLGCPARTVEPHRAAAFSVGDAQRCRRRSVLSPNQVEGEIPQAPRVVAVERVGGDAEPTWGSGETRVDHRGLVAVGEVAAADALKQR